MAKRLNPIDRTDSRVASLAALYAKAEAELTRLIVMAVSSGKGGSKRYRNQQRAVAARLLRQLEKAAVPQAELLVSTAFSAGETEARRVLKAQPVSARKKAAAQVLTDNLTKTLGEATRTVGRNVDDVLRRETLRVVNENRGDRDQQSLQLTRRLMRQGVTSFVDKSGAHWSLSTYTRMAIASVTNEAVNAGTIETMKARGFDLVEINSVHNPSTICKPHEGRVYSISGDHPKYPKLDPQPPYHPGPCRHYASPSKLAIADRRTRQEQTA